MTSAEVKTLKKWTFFKWSWSKGQLAFEDHLWSKGSLRSGLQFGVSTTHQFPAVQFLCNLFCKMGTFYLINLSNFHKWLYKNWTAENWWVVDTPNWSPGLRLPFDHSWPSKANWPLLQLHFYKVHFFRVLASAEVVLRSRSDFKVPSESPWVGLSNDTLLVSLGWELASWEPFVF